MNKVFIDGSAGTTGLRIYDRLRERSDIELIEIDSRLRKDKDMRKKAFDEADIIFLCLPDEAAKEAAEMADGNTVIIDTSSCHRSEDGWVYGFPELKQARERIRSAKRISNPGCHASGFIALVAPLVQAGVIKNDGRLSCFSLTGFSGGGKAMIAQYEDKERSGLLAAPRQYALSQQHKHLKEMKKVCALENAPVFCPIVADFYSGMELSVPLFGEEIKASKSDIENIYREYYTQGTVYFAENTDEDGFMSAAAFSGRDDMEISVKGNDERIVLIARFDNLGKGASGAAIQNMNILIGADEKQGLITYGGKVL